MKNILSTKNIHPLTDFKRNTTQFIEAIESTGEAMILTVNGRAKVVVQSAEAYQSLLDLLGDAEVVAGIRRGLADVDAGRGKSLDEAFADLRRKKGIRSKTKRAG